MAEPVSELTEEERWDFQDKGHKRRPGKATFAEDQPKRGRALKKLRSRHRSGKATFSEDADHSSNKFWSYIS